MDNLLNDIAKYKSIYHKFDNNRQHAMAFELISKIGTQLANISYASNGKKIPVEKKPENNLDDIHGLYDHLLNQL